jgi:hypothetical protein
MDPVAQRLAIHAPIFAAAPRSVHTRTPASDRIRLLCLTFFDRRPSSRISLLNSLPRNMSKRDVTAAGHYAAIACEAAPLHFHGSSSSIFVLG